MPRRPASRRAPVAAAASLALPLLACAQTAPPAPANAPTAPTTIVITGNPLGRDRTAQAASVLSGDALTVQRAGTLGETLDGQPGVASSWFGPNASRPAIRGLDGDRVRLLSNGGAAIDASNLSFDHAVAIDPLAVERVEVLRGPAALLYGGNATGGVVNTIDNRVPRTAPAGAFTGRAEARLGGAARERSGAAVLEGGSGGFAWHGDAFKRRTSDLHVPRYTPVEDGVALERTRRVRNSAADTDGGAVGGSWVGDAGFLGLAADRYRNDYGTVAEEDVLIRMKRDRLALAGEGRNLASWLPFVRVQGGHTRYQHREIEDGAVGTTFRSHGDDLRVEVRHPTFGALSGTVGLQGERLDFSALGEEAFVPDTRTRSGALFALEELQLGGGFRIDAGGRVERVRIASDGDDADAAEPRFGAAASRRYTPLSGSLALLWSAGAGVELSASVGHTERAPAYYELYANGPHVATAAYERGDPTLGVEKSRNAEIGAAWTSGPNSLKLSAWDTRFARYIALDATGAEIDEAPEFVFRAVRARLRGAEIDGRVRLLATGPLTLDLSGGFDTVRGDDRTSGEPLPRLAPKRLRAGLEAAAGRWRGGVGVRHAWRQERVPATDSATPGYTLVNLWATWQADLGPTDALVFLRLDNAGNELAYSASSVQTLRALAPLPGRALSAGLRLRF